VVRPTPTCAQGEARLDTSRDGGTAGRGPQLYLGYGKRKEKRVSADAGGYCEGDGADDLAGGEGTPGNEEAFRLPLNGTLSGIAFIQ